MKRALLSTAAVVALTAGASAADLGRPVAMPVKAPVVFATVYNWTGPYLGIVGGGGWGNSRLYAANPRVNFSRSFSPSGGFVGGTLGYNWQFNNSFVIGLEGDMSWAGIRASRMCTQTSWCQVDQDWIGTVRGRVGYAAGPALFYVTGGYAVSAIRVKGEDRFYNSSDEMTKTRSGWTIGGGLEYGFWNNWSAKAEYLYADYGSTKYGRNDGSIPVNVKFNESLFRIGINYRFGGVF